MLIDEGQGHDCLVQFVPDILAHIQRAFPRYGVKNQLVLCDTIGTLSDAVGRALSNPAYSAMYLPAVVQKFRETEDFDDYLYPVMECLASLVPAVRHSPFERLCR